MDRRDRSDFLRYFYRRFEGASTGPARGDCAEMLSDLILTKSFPQGIRRIREHRHAGHTTLLITGALDFVVEPLRPLFDHIVAAEMGSSDGAYDGRLLNVPPTGRGPLPDAGRLRRGPRPGTCGSRWPTRQHLGPPMLEAVGFPVAVNPETKLAALARRRGWLIEHWATSAGAPQAAADGTRVRGRARRSVVARPLVRSA